MSDRPFVVRERVYRCIVLRRMYWSVRLPSNARVRHLAEYIGDHLHIKPKRLVVLDGDGSFWWSHMAIIRPSLPWAMPLQDGSSTSDEHWPIMSKRAARSAYVSNVLLVRVGVQCYMYD